MAAGGLNACCYERDKNTIGIPGVPFAIHILTPILVRKRLCAMMTSRFLILKYDNLPRQARDTHILVQETLIILSTRGDSAGG